MAKKPTNADKLIAEICELKKRAAALGADQHEALEDIHDAIEHAKATFAAKGEDDEMNELDPIIRQGWATVAKSRALLDRLNARGRI